MYMVGYDLIWLDMAVYCYMWLRIAACGFIRLYMAVCDRIFVLLSSRTVIPSGVSPTPFFKDLELRTYVALFNNKCKE